MIEIEIEPLEACGDLRFGSSREEIAALIGATEDGFEVHGSGWVEVREGAPFVTCEYHQGRMVAITLDHGMVARCWVKGLDLLQTPLSEVLSEMDRLNGGTGQAQGGSLYYKTLGIGLLQFEDAGAREISVFLPDPMYQDPLRPVTVEHAIAYYVGQKKCDPTNDWFGRLP